MKRTIAISALTFIGLLVPSSALSATDVQSEQVTAKRGTFGITFDVFLKNGKPKQVGNFEYSHIDLTCESGGPIDASGTNFGTTPNTRAKVVDHEFSKSYPGMTGGGGETKNKFSGRFKNHNTKVEGALKVTGDFPAAPAENCKGKVNWVAD